MFRLWVRVWVERLLPAGTVATPTRWSHDCHRSLDWDMYKATNAMLATGDNASDNAIDKGTRQITVTH
jgi:hypothetical protein